MAVLYFGKKRELKLCMQLVSAHVGAASSDPDVVIFLARLDVWK